MHKNTVPPCAVQAEIDDLLTHRFVRELMVFQSGDREQLGKHMCWQLESFLRSLRDIAADNDVPLAAVIEAAGRAARDRHDSWPAAREVR